MRKTILVTAIACLVAVTNIASAENIRGIEIDFVTIGNPGNPGDTRAEANPTGCGAVGYDYQLGKYEVTNSQWNTFTTLAGVPTGDDQDAGCSPYDESPYWTNTNHPTTNVSWYEAAQFCNYLTSGDKSQGAYQFSGNNTNPGYFLGKDRDLAVSTYGIAYVLPTEDEWYKAAFYTGSGYSTYSNGTDIAPVAGVDTNYDSAIGNNPWEVGVGNGTEEQNATFDMLGNVWEWHETWVYSDPGIRGGAYFNGLNYGLKSSYRSGGMTISEESHYTGFRVASVPEPATVLLFGLGGLLLRRKCKS